VSSAYKTIFAVDKVLLISFFDAESQIFIT